MTTTRTALIMLALAALLAASVRLSNESVATQGGPGPLQVRAVATDPHAFGHRIANALPTAEAGFAIRRPVADETR